jgi:hypothetical protein
MATAEAAYNHKPSWRQSLREHKSAVQSIHQQVRGFLWYSSVSNTCENVPNTKNFKVYEVLCIVQLEKINLVTSWLLVVMHNTCIRITQPVPVTCIAMFPSVLYACPSMLPVAAATNSSSVVDVVCEVAMSKTAGRQ